MTRFLLLSVCLLCSVALAGTPHKPGKCISLNEVMTTGPQSNLRALREALLDGRDNDNVAALNEYLRALNNASAGPSNIFIVDATNAQDAVSATIGVLKGGRATETPAPVNKPNSISGTHWLVAYLGVGPSQPTWWVVESVTVNKGKVRVCYRRPPPSPVTSDVRPYYVWAPLGSLERNSYQLELYDLGRSAVTLMRRVEVE